MKKIIVLLIVLGCFVFNACVGVKKDAIIVTRIYFYNNTKHIIKLLPYEKGLVVTDSIKVFPPSTITWLETEKNNTPSPASPAFDFRYRRNTDSILVTFNDVKKENHHLFMPNSSKITYLPSKERCLIVEDGGAYEQKIIEQRKTYVEVEYTYTFTEQDYLDAEVIK